LLDSCWDIKFIFTVPALSQLSSKRDSEDSKNFLMSRTFKHRLLSISWKSYPPGQLPPSRGAPQDVANFFRFQRSHVTSPFAQTFHPDLGCTHPLSFPPGWTVQL